MKLRVIVEDGNLVDPGLLFVGAGEKPRVPGYMSDNALQAILYASVQPTPYVFMLDSISLHSWDLIKDSLGIVERLWFLDHAYGKDSEVFRRVRQVKPGIYDESVGEALINVPVSLQELRGMNLLRAVVRTHRNAGGSEDITPDTIYVMLQKDGIKDLFDDAFEPFVGWLRDLGYDI